MGLCDLIRHDFPDVTMAKGNLIASRGAVHGPKLARPNTLTAVVTGTEDYAVELQLDEDRAPWSQCSCPAFYKWGPCKHVWALARVADQMGLELAPGPVEAEDGAGYDDVYDDDEYDEDALASIFGRPRETDPEWQRRLRSLRAHVARTADPFEGHAGSEARLIYSLDPALSRERGVLQLDVWSQTRRKNGAWGRARRADPVAERTWTMAGPEDRDLLHPLGRHQLAWVASWRFAEAADASTRDPSLRTDRLLPALLATGRLFRTAKRGSGPKGGPLEADDGPPWIFGLSVTAVEASDSLVLQGFLVRDSERMDLMAPDLVLEGFLLAGRRVAHFDARGAFKTAVFLRDSGPITVPEHARTTLLDILCAQPGTPLLELEGLGSIREVAPTPHLAVAGPESPGAMKTRLPCRVSFAYDDFRVDAATPGGLVLDTDGVTLVRRDRDAERAAVEAFLEAGGLPPPSTAEVGEARVPTAGLGTLVRTLLDLGWTIEADGVPYRTSGGFQLSVRSGIDWFDLEGGLDFGGEVAPLPALLEAAQRGSRTVRLGDGSVGLLPERWLEGWNLAQALGRVEGDGLRFHASQGWVLDALLAAQPDVAVDRRFREYRKRLQGFTGIQPARPPRSLKATLRTYQKEGLAWLRFLDTMGLGGCLADDMGLGKTVQVLALLAGRKASRTKYPPTLVVVPRSLVHHWKGEAARFAPNLKVLDYTGLKRHAHFDAIGRHDLVVTTYGTLRRDIVKLREVRFDYAILDESQAIKNAASQSAKAARLIQADRRLALSGTPVENHLGELWSLFEFLNPGMLGKAKAFKTLVGGGNGRTLDDAGRAQLARAIRPFVLRRTKEEVLDDLPEKTEQVLRCVMGARQLGDYTKIRDHVRSTLLEKAKDQPVGRMKIHVLEALLRLRQVACHVGLLDPARRDESSAKLDVLMPLIEEVLASDHKVLVFSQFTKLLSIVRDRLDALGVCYEYLDGRTRKRQERIDRFQQDDACGIFLISLKAGGLGLNLTAADYVFLLDPWWNPAVERQAVDRAHRIGQTRPVIAYRLICSDTVEEKVLELQSEKRQLAEAVIGGDRSLLKDLTREDLEVLFA